MFPSVDTSFSKLIKVLINKVDEFNGLDAEKIIVVFQSADGQVAASARSLAAVSKEVLCAGKSYKIEIALRPIFFQTGNAQRRLATLIHELLHIDPSRNNHLLQAHKHHIRGHQEHERQSSEICERVLPLLEAKDIAFLAHNGFIKMRSWLIRPCLKTANRRFKSIDFFELMIPMKTSKNERSTWF